MKLVWCIRGIQWKKWLPFEKYRSQWLKFWHAYIYAKWAKKTTPKPLNCTYRQEELVVCICGLCAASRRWSLTTRYRTSCRWWSRAPVTGVWPAAFHRTGVTSTFCCLLHLCTNTKFNGFVACCIYERDHKPKCNPLPLYWGSAPALCAKCQFLMGIHVLLPVQDLRAWRVTRATFGSNFN